MTPDQFREHAARLGLSDGRLGAALGGITDRTIRRYKSGELAVPPTVAVLMNLYVRSLRDPALRKNLERAVAAAEPKPEPI